MRIGKHAPATGDIQQAQKSDDRVLQENVNKGILSLTRSLSSSIDRDLYVDRFEETDILSKVLAHTIVLVRALLGEGKSSILRNIYTKFLVAPNFIPIYLDFNKFGPELEEMLISESDINNEFDISSESIEGKFGKFSRILKTEMRNRIEQRVKNILSMIVNG